MAMQSDYGAGGAAEGQRIRDDGITQMSGTVDFGSGGTSIDVNVTGGTSNDNNFEAYGGEGTSDPVPNGTAHAGTLNGARLTASGMPTGTTGTAYTVAVTYVEGGRSKAKRGTVAATHVTAGGTAPITLT